jgi:short subunit dehydrogenase
VPADGTKRETLKKVVERTVAEFGALDTLIAAQGATSSGIASRKGDGAWFRALDVNLTGAFFLASEALPHLVERRGSIVMISSTAGMFAGPPGTVGYTAAKSGVIGLVRWLARDFGPRGVRVNAICPGWVRTALADDAMAYLAKRDGSGSWLGSFPGWSANPQDCQATPVSSSTPVMSFRTAPGPGLQMLASGLNCLRMKADHEHRTVGHLARQLDHARPGGEEVHGCRRVTRVEQPADMPLEVHRLAREKPADRRHGLAHEGYGAAGPADGPRRQEARPHGETDTAGRDLLQRMGSRREEQRVAHNRARRGWIEPQAARSRGGQGERHEHVAASMRMIVHAHAVEAGVLAAGDEVCHAGHRHSHRNTDIDLHAMAIPRRRT